MIAHLYSNHSSIGVIKLYSYDPSIGNVSGVLEFSEVYLGLQDVFHKSKGRNNTEIASLNLTAQLENGCYLYPINGFRIIDSTNVPGETTIEILGLHNSFLNQLNNSTKIHEFMEEPWCEVNIYRKYDLERELVSLPNVQLKQVKNGIRQFRIFKLETLAIQCYSDEVLYYIRGGKDDFFAVVQFEHQHIDENRMVLSGRNPPMITFYPTLEAFYDECSLRKSMEVDDEPFY